jgi:hypothetical protein
MPRVPSRSRHISFREPVHYVGACDRPDVARRRAQWIGYQNRVGPNRLVFIDETWARTDMAPLRVWARGHRLPAKVPHGGWKTTTLLAALRHDRIVAPWLVEGPIDGETFRTYVEKILVPTLHECNIVIMDNLGNHKGKAVRALIRAVGAKLFFLPKDSQQDFVAVSSEFEWCFSRPATT